MKKDIDRIIIFVWMSVIAYFVYEMWIDLNYMSDLVHAYIKMAVGHMRH